MISINTLFFITYHFGDAARKPIKIAGVILFIALVSGVISLVIRFFVLWRRKRKLKTDDQKTIH
jgi:membrane protein DedA with SNARE-associated domain